ncbi:MAG: SspB family protein [Alphaproteobacteria bacterium]
MAEGSIAYAQLVEAALMGVVRRVLADAARDGIEPPHHFYITFRTDHPDVDMPAELRQRYRQEMTIVLQHQFWDLEVGEERFAVTLSFSGRPHRLSVPFSAVKVFADPGVEFGLQFTLADAEADGEAAPGLRAPAPIMPLGERGDAPAGDEPAAAADGVDAGAAAAGDDEGEGEDKGAEIVTLDRFRKR